jgi:molecular chaperone GrpE
MKSRKRHKPNEHRPEPAAGPRGEASDSAEFQNEEGEFAEEPVSEDEPAEADPASSLEADLLKWRELAMRTSADLDNYRKRVARDREESLRYANQSLIEELLPILDNFEMGMQAAAGEESSMIYIGMDMVRKQFAEFLAAHGVEPVEVKPGDEFDHATQEAVAQEPDDEIEEGRVLRVMRRGFTMRGRLLRPATVVVSTGPATEHPEEGRGQADAD